MIPADPEERDALAAEYVLGTLDARTAAEVERGLATDEALRADLRGRGLGRAAQFTWERCARETLEVLLEAV